MNLMPLIVTEALEVATVTGSKITLSNDPLVAAKDADVLYTDVAKPVWEEKQNKIFGK